MSESSTKVLFTEMDIFEMAGLKVGLLTVGVIRKAAWRLDNLSHILKSGWDSVVKA